MTFGQEKEVEIFKALAHKSAREVGIEYGVDKVYKNMGNVRKFIQAIYNKVRNNAPEYGVSEEVVKMVEDGMAARKAAVVGEPKEKAEDEAPVDFKETVQDIRNQTFGLIQKKITRVNRTPSLLDKVSFKDLGIIAGITFDKLQILKGEATENITVLAKVDSNISPEDAVKLALQTREQHVANNTDRG